MSICEPETKSEGAVKSLSCDGDFIMLDTSQWLDLYKANKGIASDYGLAKNWGLHQSYVRQFRDGRLRLPLGLVLEIAAATGIEPLEIVAALEYHRAAERYKPLIKRVYFDSLVKTIGARMSYAQARYRKPSRF